jgi:hypothetical protein
MIIEIEKKQFQALKDIQTRLKKAFEKADSFDRNKLIKAIDNQEKLIALIEKIESINQ